LLVVEQLSQLLQLSFGKGIYMHLQQVSDLLVLEPFL